MRLIDADALLKAIANYPYGYRGMIESEIENQPTVDAVPVRHGKWRKYYIEQPFLRCSECGHPGRIASNYCQDCGAKMDKE